MFNPITFMKLANERHEFIKNHPDLYPFLKENFGTDMKAGDIIEIKVQKGNALQKSIEIEIQESEKALFDSLKEFVNQIS